MTFSHIVEIAAWIYVIKQLLPIVFLPTVLFVCYIAMRLMHGDKEKANQEFLDAVLKGVKDALDDY